MLVTIGTLSLIVPDPEEQIISVYNIVEFSQFDPVSLKHDIALIQVFDIVNCYKFKKEIFIRHLALFLKSF
jgi:hypothetical protein